MPTSEEDDARVQSEKEEAAEEESVPGNDGASVVQLDSRRECIGETWTEEEIDVNTLNTPDTSPGAFLSKSETSLPGSEKYEEIGKEDDDNGDDNDEDEDLPIDKGWAWVVLAGGFLNVAVMVGYIRGLSILFIEYLKVFNASAAKTTLLMGVNSGVYSISALLSMHILVGMVGIRKTLFIGATISAVGMAVAISPISIDFLIGTHSIVLGIGNSMIFGPSVVIVGKYFKKRHGFASALMMSGISFGGGIYPPLTRYLLDEYGLQGTMIILTGLSMNMFVGAAVCIPLESFRKKKPVTTTGTTSVHGECTRKLKDVEQATDIKMSSSCSLGPAIKSEKRDLIVVTESPFLLRKATTAVSTTSSTSRSTRNMLIYASQPDLGSVVSLPNAQTLKLEELYTSDETKNISCVGLRNVLSALDFTLFKKTMFRLVILYSFFNVLISMNGAYLPALASEKGISQSDAALFLTILGAIDFLCRLSVGVVIDRGYIKVNKLMAVGLIVIGTASQFTYFYNSYAFVLIFAVIIGMSTCTYFALVPVAIIEFIGLEGMAKTLGFISLFHGISIAIANPVIGGISDATGSYCGGYTYIGVCSYIGAILLLCVPLIRRRVNQDIEKSPELDAELKPLKDVKHTTQSK